MKLKITISLSETAFNKLDEMAVTDSRNRSREAEWLINTEWTRRQVREMTKVGALVSGPDPGPRASDDPPPTSGPKVKTMKDGGRELE